MDVQVLRDTESPEVLQGVIRVAGIHQLPPQTTFRLEPLDPDISTDTGWPTGDIRPHLIRVKSAGIEIVFGWEVIDAPKLLPGVAVRLTIPSAAIRTDITWPDFTNPEPMPQPPALPQPAPPVLPVPANVHHDGNSEHTVEEKTAAHEIGGENRPFTTSAEHDALVLPSQSDGEPQQPATFGEDPDQVIQRLLQQAAAIRETKPQPSGQFSDERDASQFEPAPPHTPSIEEISQSIGLTAPPSDSESVADYQTADSGARHNGDMSEVPQIGYSEDPARLLTVDDGAPVPPVDFEDQPSFQSETPYAQTPAVTPVQLGQGNHSPPARIESYPHAQQPPPERADDQPSSSSLLLPFAIGFVAAAILNILVWTSIKDELSTFITSGADASPAANLTAPTSNSSTISANTATMAMPAPLYEVFKTADQSPSGRSTSGVSLQQALTYADKALYGDPPNVDEGRFWLRRAGALAMGELRMKWALTQLGSLYARDAGQENYAIARALWQLSGSQGDPVALCFLASLYEHGLGVPKSKITALSYMQAAKRIGDCDGTDKALTRLNQ